MTTKNNRRPLIGVFPSRSEARIKLAWNYLDAIYAAGGMGVPLGYTTDEEKIQTYVDMMDGFVLSGGVDWNPMFYGEEKQFDSVEIDEERDAFEKAAFSVIMASGKPILGVCRGIQTINVCMGGTLYQHIEGHRQDKPATMRTHTLEVIENTYFHELIGQKSIIVNSFHHQNVKDLAPGLEVCAVSSEGYVEVVYAPQHKFLLGVQFHPEYYYDQADDDHAHLIFEALIRACLE